MWMRRHYNLLLVLLVLATGCSSPALAAEVKKGDCATEDSLVKKRKGCPAGVAVDYTLNTDVLGCWAITSDTAQASAEADRCAAGGTDNMTFVTAGGVYDTNPNGPLGTAVGQRVVNLTLANTEHFALSHQAEFESAEFSVMGWVRLSNDTNAALMSKNELQWELFRIATGDGIRGEINNQIELSASTLPTTEWHFVGMRHDGNGDLEIQTLFDGHEDCGSGGCADALVLFPSGTDDLVIGGNSAGGETVGGRVMEWSYWQIRVTDQVACEVMLCGLNATADGPARDAEYGTAACGCDTITTCC